MTGDEAIKIRDVFGPCTVLYETMSPEDIIYDSNFSHSLMGYIEDRYDIEVIHMDGLVAASFHHGKEAHEKAKRDRDDFKRRLLCRLADAGWEI